MTTHPAVASPARIVGVVALLAATVIGVGYGQVVSPAGSILAECFDGQTVDPATGTCPPGPSIVNGTDDIASNPAVKDAQQANQLDESFEGGNG